MSSPTPGSLMHPEEVAKIYNVDPKTVTRWARAGRIRSTKTPGGQWRIYADAVLSPETSAHNEGGPPRCTTTGTGL